MTPKSSRADENSTHLDGGSSHAPEEQIGSRIAEKRLEKKLTHDGLAKLTKLVDDPKNEKAGISRTTIRGYEVGMYKPGARELRLLSLALEVSPTWLIFGSAEPSALSASKAIEQGNELPPTELQKFVVALHLLRGLTPTERDVVYSVLHNLARLKFGEREYRAATIVHGEMGALLSDLWADIREGNEFDQEKCDQLVQAYGPLLDQVMAKNLPELAAKALGGVLKK